MSLEHCGGVFSGQVYCRLPCTWQEMRPGLFQKNYALCDGVLKSFQLSRSLVLLIFDFLAFFCFNLYIGNFLTTILSHVLGTRRDFWDGYQLKDIDGYQYQLTVINWRSLAVFAEISILDVWRGSLIRLCVGG